MGSEVRGRDALSVSWKNIVPKPDPRSLPFYLCLGSLIPLSHMGYAMTGMQLADADVAQSLQTVATVPIFIAWMLRRAGLSRISTGIETLVLLYIMSSFVIVLQYAMLATPFGYADEWLLAADRFLWFDWLTFARWFKDPASFAVLKAAYASMHYQAPTLLALLCLTRRETRAWQVLTAALIALVATIGISAFFPADGRYVICGLNAPDIPRWPGICGYSSTIHLIKYEGVRLIERSMLTGVVSFPSFHTAAACLLMWGAWDLKWARIPMVALNTLMIVSTIVVGAHYLIDIVAGTAVAVASVWVTVRIVRPGWNQYLPGRSIR